MVEGEYRSGYSGARTFLAVPIKPDGRSDAHAIVKIGDAGAIAREYDNYRRFVKDNCRRSPPGSKEPPVTAEGNAGPGKMAALRYTFVGAGDQRPVSLREALLKQPDPALLRQLFDTFGPTWWMQRHARTFICAQADRPGLARPPSSFSRVRLRRTREKCRRPPAAARGPQPRRHDLPGPDFARVEAPARGW